MLKKTITLSMFSLLSSCAPMITYIPEKKVEEPVALTPIEQIDDFKIENEKDQITQIVNQEYEEPNSFLMDVNNENVKFWENYFGVKNRERFERFLNNGEKFKKIIEEIFVDHGLPKELYYVGLIESGYYLRARSHANAVGPWQFITSTAKRYGLKVNSKVDERKNIHKSTKAAALFFQDLYNIFGSWELALSAYNAGEYGIIRRIRNANTRDYYQLSQDNMLPKETINYVPKVLAAIKIAANPQKYKIKVNEINNNIYDFTKTVSLNNSFHLKDIAKASSIDLSILKELNPDILTNYTPANSKSSFELIIPQKSIDFISKISPVSHKSISNSPNTYIVKNGDFLGKIARLNHTSVSQIMILNNLKGKTIYKGQLLKLPYIDKTIYTVKRGDYLGKIANRFGISISKIKKLNSMRRSRIYPGQRLIVSLN